VYQKVGAVRGWRLEFTVIIRTARIKAQTIMNMPPLKSAINPIFLGSFKLVFHSIGIGMERR
jgi:hypothetical protein